MICLNSALIRLLALKHLFHSKVLAVVVLIMNSVLIRSLAEADDGRNNCSGAVFVSSGHVIEIFSFWWQWWCLGGDQGQAPGAMSQVSPPYSPPYPDVASGLLWLLANDEWEIFTNLEKLIRPPSRSWGINSKHSISTTKIIWLSRVVIISWLFIFDYAPIECFWNFTLA